MVAPDRRWRPAVVDWAGTPPRALARVRSHAGTLDERIGDEGHEDQGHQGREPEGHRAVLWWRQPPADLRPLPELGRRRRGPRGSRHRALDVCSGHRRGMLSWPNHDSNRVTPG